jgi:quercetin dioxygenase-like cupin family protein
VNIDEGAVLPEHSHPHEQFTKVVEGKIEFTIGNETRMLTANMVAHMPPNVPHSARAITKVVVFDTFYPVREDLRERSAQAVDKFQV